MNSNYQLLFKVQLEHNYFSDKCFTGFKIVTTDKTNVLLHTHGLLFKPAYNGFAIVYDGFFRGTMRDRVAVLKENITLQFTVHIDDPSFYIYTANLPYNLKKRILWFSNFNEPLLARKNSDLLHKSLFVSENEIKPSVDHFNYDGYIEIQFNDDLPEDLYIRFLNRAVYWRYIVAGEHLQKFKNLAVIDKAKKILFAAPQIIELAAGAKATAFISNKPILLTQHNNNHFHLVAGYNEITDHFEQELIPELPGPALKLKKEPNDEGFIAEIFIN